MENMQELNIEALGNIAGGNALNEDDKGFIRMEIRMCKLRGISLESILEDLSLKGKEEIREYIESVWDDVKPFV